MADVDVMKTNYLFFFLFDILYPAKKASGVTYFDAAKQKPSMILGMNPPFILRVWCRRTLLFFFCFILM